MDYKKIFKTRRARARMLRKLRLIPDKPMLRLQYRIKMGKGLHLRKPELFTEKLQWYKLYYRDPLMKRCVNKLEVREFVKERGLEDILIPLIASYEKPTDIDWNSLPEQFVMKTAQGGGGLSVVVCADKSKTSLEELQKKLWFVNDRVGERNGGREWAYYGIRTGILVEQRLVNRENPEAGVNDYKFFCYDGKPMYIVADTTRFTGHKRNFYDTEWNNLHVTSDCPACDHEIPRPPELEKMLAAAARLSDGFPFVRVDLYDVDGRVWFGELTFYPWSGYVRFQPQKWDRIFGEPFRLQPCQKTE